MVQSNQVYIYKLWDMCTLWNARNSGALTASRFRAGTSLWVSNWESFTGEDIQSRNTHFSAYRTSFPLNLFWLLRGGEENMVVLFFNNCISNMGFTSNDDDVKWCSVIAEFRSMSEFPWIPSEWVFKTWPRFYWLRRRKKKINKKLGAEVSRRDGGLRSFGLTDTIFFFLFIEKKRRQTKRLCRLFTTSHVG